jgi:hypothetical protein
VLYLSAIDTLWILKNDGGTFRPVDQQGNPGNGLGGYDLRLPANRTFAQPQPMTLPPVRGIMCILEINGGNFRPVYQEGSPGNEIASDDLKSPGDQAFAFAYDYSRKIGHLALYRPGTGTFWVLAIPDGKSHPVDYEGGSWTRCRGL